MAQMKPQTKEDFAKISGVGQHKLKQYGDPFISEIRTFCQLQQLPTPIPSESQMFTLQLYQQGLSIEEIAENRNFKISTISTHLAELIEMGQTIDINQLVIPVKQEVILKAIQTIGGDTLTPLKTHLGDSYSYEEIKFVRAWWRKSQQS